MTAAATPAPSFVLRPMTSDDLNFVRKSWLTSYIEDAPAWLRAVGSAAFWSHHIQVRDRLLERGDVLIASIADEPSAICGWACTEPGSPALVHYVYVKPRWRRLGIASQLLAAFAKSRAVCTHQTALCKQLPTPSAWSFNLYEAFR